MITRSCIKHIGSIFIAFVCLFIHSPIFSAPYFTYLGGNLSESANAITTDSQDNIYITGATNSDHFDNLNLPKNKKHFNNQNCFVARINLNNSELNYYVEFAGSSRETCRAIAVDSAFNVYVTGETQSVDLPVTTNTQFSGVWDSFVFKLNALGELVYATYIGGTLSDYGHGITLRGIDDIFITGETWSMDFPTTQNAYTQNCRTENICTGDKANAFITHIDTSISTQYTSLYSTYFGGDKDDKSHSISIDPLGILHIGGETQSSNFPLKNEIGDSLKGIVDGFIIQIDPQKNAKESLLFSRYLGGSGEDVITAITSNALGESIVTGRTSSDDFPTTSNAFSRRCANGQVKCLTSIKNLQHSDGFVTKITNNIIRYSSLFGGSKDETSKAVVIDSNGIIYITGITHSADFPLTDNASDVTCNETRSCSDFNDGFLLKIDSTLSGKSSLIYSSYLGGDNIDSPAGLHLTNNNEIVLTGETHSANLASSNGLDMTQENSEAYLQKIEVLSNGSWVDNTPKQQKKTASSSLSLVYLIGFAVLGGCLRNTKWLSYSRQKIRNRGFPYTPTSRV